MKTLKKLLMKRKIEQIKENIKNTKCISETDQPLQSDNTPIQEKNQVTQV